MLNSFVGLVQYRQDLELESLLPENRAAQQWSFAYARRRPMVAVWAVMDCVVAAEIVELLTEGEGAAALRYLAGGAERMGPLQARHDGTAQGAL